MAEKFTQNYQGMEGMAAHPRISYEHRVSQNSLLLDAAEYTFTDRELQDVLGFVELMNGTTTPNDIAAGLELIGLPKHERVDTGVDTFVPPIGLPAGVAGLQFQPHFRRVSHDGTNTQSSFAAALPPSLLPVANARPPINHSNQFVNVNQQPMFSGLPPPITIPKNSAQPVNYKAMEHPDSPNSMKDGNMHKPSHGASEKQRRDKINAMIDQLRRLVPPPHTDKAEKAGKGDGGDGKRSKYVVLQNTITTINMLNAKVAAQDQEIQRLHAMLAAAQSSQAMMEQQHRQQQQENACNGNMLLFHDDSERANAAQPANSAETTGSDSSNGERDRLMMPGIPNGQSTPGVEVDMGPEHCYLKVSCPDRRGLLADVLHALRSLPLEITRAAITTGPDGFATDIFELKQLNQGTEKEMSAEEIQAAVEARLQEAEDWGMTSFKEECQELIGKRRKRPSNNMGGYH